MEPEILTIVVTLRVAKANLEDTIDKLRTGALAPVSVPRTVRVRAVNHHPQGSTDPDWPQIRIEYSK